MILDFDAAGMLPMKAIEAAMTMAFDRGLRPSALFLPAVIGIEEIALSLGRVYVDGATYPMLGVGCAWLAESQNSYRGVRIRNLAAFRIPIGVKCQCACHAVLSYDVRVVE